MTDDDMSHSECAAALDLPAELMLRLLTPFRPQGGERVSLKQALAVAILSGLCMLEDRDAAATIAAVAAGEARADGRRILAISWRHNKPQACWVAGVSDALERIALVIPVERLLQQLTARKLAYREARALPN